MTTKPWGKTLLVCAFFAQPISTHAAANTELLELKNTILNLVDELVNQGVLTEDSATTIKQQAALKAREQVARQAIAEGRAENLPDTQAGRQQVVRVPYVPEFVREEIRAEVREELRADVTADVVATARDEGWGTPDALPDWVNRLKFFGDARVMYKAIRFDNSNDRQMPKYLAINNAGGLTQAGTEAFLNATEDQDWFRMRARLGVKAALGSGYSAVIRLASGNDVSPISRNRTLGNYFASYDVVLDQVYLEWDSKDLWLENELQVQGGRIPNPFFHTSMMWDRDLVFDGVSTNYVGPFWGEGNRFFTNAGVFTLLPDVANEPLGSTDGKWLWSIQGGLDLEMTEESRVKFAVGYYQFENVVGQLNDPFSTTKDWTAPEFLTKGNSVFDIRNDGQQTNRFALASEFELVNVIAEFAYTGFAPFDVVLTADYTQNIGFDDGDVSARVGAPVSEKNEAWLAQFEIGWRDIAQFGRWSVFGGYRSIERDAVMDAFTDSDFHLAGTDTEGWIAGIRFGVATNSWLRARVLSADEIDGARNSIDVIQVDLNGRF